MSSSQNSSPASPPPPRPPFSALPLHKDGPRGNCWGLFGNDDELGQLNYITAEVTREATKEIQSGVRVSVNLPLDFVQPPTFNRMNLEHKVFPLEHPAVYDDEVKFNTQASTQWDGFRHFGHQTTKLFYNNTTHDDINSSHKMGTHKWAENGGIATRGVLLDYKRWADSQSTSKPAFERSMITAEELRAVAASQGVSFRQGDVLMVRTGYVAAYAALGEGERAERTTDPWAPYVGLEPAEDTVRFVWESGIVAVATDTPSCETWPVDLQDDRFWLHQWLLAGWGAPIGEYFDLERLSEECEKAKRWTFFFTSMPLNVKGGVATPVSGMAIL